MPTSEERKFLVDILIPEDPDETLRTTSTGDLRTITGMPNLVGAIRRRGISNPGDMLHRPDYGFGLTDAVERLMTPAQISAVQNAGRRNVLRDPRVETSKVTAKAVGTTLEVRVDITAKNSDEQTSTTITVE